MKVLYENELGKITTYGFQFAEKQKGKEFFENLKVLMQKAPFEEASMLWRDAGDFYDREYNGYVGIENIIKNWGEFENAPWDEIEVKGRIVGVDVFFYVKSAGSGQDYPYIATGSRDPENDGLIEFLKNYK